jgi:imidazolonepropionase-like amidohydrolase
MSGDLDVLHGLLWLGAGRWQENGVVQIRSGRIDAVVDGASYRHDGRTRQFDAHGSSVLPGLIDTHVHLTTNSDHRRVVSSASFRGEVPTQEKLLHGLRNAYRALRAGFTTLRVMGHRDAGEVQMRNLIEDGLLLGPRLRVAPWWITMTHGHGDLFYPKYVQRREWDTADGVDACRTAVRLQARHGADFIKVMASGGMSEGERPHWPNYSTAELRAIVEEAHDLDLKVAAHAVSTEGIRRALAAGVDSIEHGSYLTPELAQEMVDRGTFLVPTLAFNDWCQREGTRRGLTPDAVRGLQDAHDRALESFSLAHRVGVQIAMGTDSSGTLCPFGAHARELELYVKYGMSVNEALTTATTTAARLLDLDHDIGRLAPGYLGDLVVVSGDVRQGLAPLTVATGIAAVVARGRLVSDAMPAIDELMAW